MGDLGLLPESAPSGPVLAHCDVLRAAQQVAPTTDRRELLDRHLARLARIAQGRQLWFPTFNYDFCKTGIYDVDHDRSQVGRLTEAARQQSRWRSSSPVFNVCGLTDPLWDGQAGETRIDPFGDTSVFAQLVAADGVVLWYGAGIESTTTLHHCEHRAGGAPYRYIKSFAGSVRQGRTERSVTLDYSVRPMGHPLQYNWLRLQAAAEKEGVRRPLDSRHQVWWAPARNLAQAWTETAKADPTGLLDAMTREWVDAKLQQLGRPFEQEDFEP